MIAKLIVNMLRLLKRFKNSLNYSITREEYIKYRYIFCGINCMPQLCVSLYIQYISGR